MIRGHLLRYESGSVISLPTLVRQIIVGLLAFIVINERGMRRKGELEDLRIAAEGAGADPT